MNNIEIKHWNEYNSQEKIDLIQHWRCCYGKMVVTQAERMEFSHLVENYSDKILTVAIACYIHGISAQPMNEKYVDRLILALLNVDEDEKFEKLCFQAQDGFIAMLVESYNNQQPTMGKSR